MIGKTYRFWRARRFMRREIKCLKGLVASSEALVVAIDAAIESQERLNQERGRDEDEGHAIVVTGE